MRRDPEEKGCGGIQRGAGCHRGWVQRELELPKAEGRRAQKRDLVQDGVRKRCSGRVSSSPVGTSLCYKTRHLPVLLLKCESDPQGSRLWTEPWMRPWYQTCVPGVCTCSVISVRRAGNILGIKAATNEAAEEIRAEASGQTASASANVLFSAGAVAHGD